MNALVETKEEPVSEFEAALQNLVNVDHIDEQPAAKMKLTMMQEEEKKKTKKGHSVPIPPVAHGMIGTNATLQQIKSVKPVSVPKFL